MLGLREADVFILEDKYVIYKLDIDKGMFWLFDVEDGSYFDLNASSFFILSQFDGNKSLSQVREEVVTKYSGANSSEVARDFDELVAELITKKVLIKKGGNENG